MGWLRRGKKDRPKFAGQPADPMSAVPILSPDVEWRADGADLVQVRRRWRPRQGVAGLIARTFKLDSVCRVNLDQRGSFFWRQIDGQSDVRRIARRLAEQFDLADQEARDAAVTFVKQLMTRCLIVLEVKRPAAKASSAGSAHGRGRGGGGKPENGRQEDQP
jgi:hypothetical protein